MTDLMRCVDRWGREVVLTEERWQTHILDPVNGHAEMLGNEACVRQALTDPSVVMHDRDYPNRENFYRAFTLPPPFDRTYLKVCVQYSSPGPRRPSQGTVITAYSTTAIKWGERQKWP